MTVATLILTCALSAPDVFLISVDTLRADHLGCYGHEYNTSPNLDALAENALVFDNAVCETPLTAPSFGAMMTSRYPRMTGLTRNGLSMPDEVPTVAEQFKAAGYKTVAVLSNWTLKQHLSNMKQGFDIYEDSFHKKRWGLIKPERDAKDVSDIALELLEGRNPDQPMFAWFHYSDPHAPYEKREDFNVAGEIGDSDIRGASQRRDYNSEVAYTDHHIGRVLDALPAENAYIVFVADHGESLFEHDYLGHGRYIYQVSMKIPFFIAGPNIAPGRSGAPVRGLDVGPTLLGLAGLSSLPGALGMDVLAEDIPGNRIRVIETYGGAVPNLPGAEWLMADRPPQWQGVIVENWKLCLEGDRPELYNLDKDPGELNDLSDQFPQKVRELHQIVREWSKETDAVDGEGPELSDEDVEALESLGYID